MRYSWDNLGNFTSHLFQLAKNWPSVNPSVLGVYISLLVLTSESGLERNIKRLYLSWEHVQFTNSHPDMAYSGLRLGRGNIQMFTTKSSLPLPYAREALPTPEVGERAPENREQKIGLHKQASSVPTSLKSNYIFRRLVSTALARQGRKLRLTERHADPTETSSTGCQSYIF